MDEAVCVLCRRGEKDLNFGSLLDLNDSQISHLTHNIISFINPLKLCCAKCCQELAFVGQSLFKWKEKILLSLESAVDRKIIKKERNFSSDNRFEDECHRGGAESDDRLSFKPDADDDDDDDVDRGRGGDSPARFPDNDSNSLDADYGHGGLDKNDDNDNDDEDEEEEDDDAVAEEVADRDSLKTDGRSLDAVHEKLLSEEKEKETFTCHFCAKSFKLEGPFRRHVAAHTAVHACELCGKVMATAVGLKRHLLLHKNKGQYKCDQCDKAYNNRGNLLMHKHIHHEGGSKSYLCRYCPKAFWRKADLQGHERIHTKEKPFACQHCGKKFRKNMIRKQHEATHGDRERKYACGICGSTFFNLGYRNEHVKIQHNPPKIPCPYQCGKMFRRNQKAKEHAKICPLTRSPGESRRGYRHLQIDG